MPTQLTGIFSGTAKVYKCFIKYDALTNKIIILELVLKSLFFGVKQKQTYYWKKTDAEFPLTAGVNPAKLFLLVNIKFIRFSLLSLAVA